MTQLVGESPFMKRVLVPFWVIRILVMVIDIAAYAIVLIAIGGLSSRDRSRLSSDYGTGISTINTIIAISAVIMVIILICLILDIVCIVKRARRSLTPKFFLIVNVIQTTIFVVLFILSMIGARTGLTVAIQVIILLSFIGVLIYASVIFHQSRKGTLKRGAYTQTANPALDPSGSFPQNNAANISYASPAQYPPHPNQQYAGYTGHSESSTPKPYDANSYGVPGQQQGYTQPQQYQQYSQQAYGQPQQYGQQAYGQQGHELQGR